MNVTINGKQKNVTGNTTVTNLFLKFNIKTKNIALELNGEILPKSEWLNYIVKEGDTIEIVEAIGGG
ncbi:MAG: sulfur carrier protein ThiS [Pseudomonadota bacterium]